MTGREPESPGALLSRLNLGLLRRNIEERYATLCCAVLEPDRRLRYSNAGHPPPLLVTSGGVRPLVTGGPILGVFENAVFPSETLQLSPGDSLVLYSDGVTEAAAPDGSEFGIDRLTAALAACAGARPAALVEALLASVKEFSGDAASVDDATIAVLTVR